MRSRKDLSPIFKAILASKYTSYNVYYQPPSGHKIEYPCIIYQRANYDTDYADNEIYRNHTHYTVTLISNDADNDSIIEQLQSIRYCSFDRRFISDNYYHDVFDLYY